MRYRVAEAIYTCTQWEKNRECFGECSVVEPLVMYLWNKNFKIANNSSFGKSKTNSTQTISQGGYSNLINGKATSEVHASKNDMQLDKTTTDLDSLHKSSENKSFIGSVQMFTSKALFELSKYPLNCIRMHEASVVQVKLKALMLNCLLLFVVF